jgi:anti-sigma regulatory factor (Ser/Thr protein kinase)
MSGDAVAWEQADWTKGIAVELPSTFSSHTMYSIIGELLDPDPKCKHGLVILDFKRLARIKVGGVAVLCNLVEATTAAGGLIHLEGFEDCPAAEYLYDSGFSALYGSAQTDERIYGTNFSPLRKVEYSRSHSYITSRLIPWMAGVLQCEEAGLATIQGCLSEIFNNIIDHSSVEVGCCCAEYDAGEKTVTICISDFGVGIPHNVKSYQFQSGPSKISKDSDAIAWACQEGYTTRTTPRNMGVGLYYLLSQVCGKNQGRVSIYSGEGSVAALHNPGSKSRIKLDRRLPGGFYPGTLFYITIHVDKFKPDHVSEEEFSW